MAEKWDHYNARNLVDDVVQLLEQRGTTPDRERMKSTKREQLEAAQKLLSSIGIVPTLAPEDSLDLDGHMDYNRRVHGD
ncbi:hypothetical protein [Saccharothrix deserti]|uniref:hypothetical protein n=1 Tax=Saccharothrix deserti TaxID=2593674 RepID=UPI00131AA7B4|nr:hypothetical protein [Saccharothrix deserti]